MNNDIVELTCPRCKHVWLQALQNLEKVETVFKDIAPQPQGAAEEYRAPCPVCGIYAIVMVGEE